jgi:hypothetical protein
MSVGVSSSGREGEEGVLVRNCWREETNEVWEDEERWKWVEEGVRRGERDERKMRSEKPIRESAKRMIRDFDLEICFPAIFSDLNQLISVFSGTVREDKEDTYSDDTEYKLQHY